MIFLFWAIIKVLSNIENSFNDIWGVKTPRSIGRRFSDYLSVMLVCPFLLVIAGSATVVISSQARVMIQRLDVYNAVGSIILLLLEQLPFCTVWIAFTFIFIFMPNTKVRFKSALFAGVVGN